MFICTKLFLARTLFKSRWWTGFGPSAVVGWLWFIRMICLESSSLLLANGATVTVWPYTNTILSKLNGLLMFMMLGFWTIALCVCVILQISLGDFASLRKVDFRESVPPLCPLRRFRVSLDRGPSQSSSSCIHSRLPTGVLYLGPVLAPHGAFASVTAATCLGSCPERRLPAGGRVRLRSILVGVKSAGGGKALFPHSCLLSPCRGCFTPGQSGHRNSASNPGPNTSAHEIVLFFPLVQLK